MIAIPGGLADSDQWTAQGFLLNQVLEMSSSGAEAPLKHAAAIFPRLLLCLSNAIEFGQRKAEGLLAEYPGAGLQRLDAEGRVGTWWSRYMHKIRLLCLQHRPRICIGSRNTMPGAICLYSGAIDICRRNYLYPTLHLIERLYMEFGDHAGSDDGHTITHYADVLLSLLRILRCESTIVLQALSFPSIDVPGIARVVNLAAALCALRTSILARVAAMRIEQILLDFSGQKIVEYIVTKWHTVLARRRKWGSLKGKENFSMTQGTQESSRSILVGTSLPRQDGPDKVTGHARYAGDRTLQHMLYARLVLSPYGHARILNIDVSAALAVPGVVAVFTAETLGMTQADPLSRAQTPLARQEVLWCGQPVAIVVGQTEACAEDGVAAVEVDYEPLPAVVEPEAAMQPESPLARTHNEFAAKAEGNESFAFFPGAVPVENEELSQNVRPARPLRIGDIETGLREADVVIERSYRTNPVHQSYLEPHTVTVAPGVSNSHLTIWPSTQGLFNVRSAVAKALDMPERLVHVESVPIGGGFGGKETLLEPLVAAVVQRLHRPVQLTYTRQEDLLSGNPAPQMVITLKLGAKRNGTLTAIQARMLFDSGAYPNVLAGLSGFHFASIYRCPHIDVRCYVITTNKPGTGAYRAPAGPQAYFAIESTVQDLCQQLEIDPLQFRRINALKEGDPNIMGSRWPRIGLLECLEQIEQHPLWMQRDRARQDVPEELKGWKIGIGVAAGGWPGGTEPAAALCRLEQDSSITIVVGSVDVSGSDTSLALIAAEELGLPVSSIHIVHDNTDSMPYSGLSAGSKTTYTVGSAVQAAARDARNQILTIAADMLEASLEDMELRDGRAAVKGVPEKHVTLQQIAARSMNFGAPYEPIFGRGRSANRFSSPMFAAHLARVAVDPETGEVRVLDYLAAQDVGRALNPAEVEGQIHGGVVQGIGWALCEGMTYSQDGQLLTSTLMDYALPHSQDAPVITPLLVEVPSMIGPFGAKGVGEPPVVPVAAAIANAIKDAVGVRMTQRPMTAERVLAALSEKH